MILIQPKLIISYDLTLVFVVTPGIVELHHVAEPQEGKQLCKDLPNMYSGPGTLPGIMAYKRSKPGACPQGAIRVGFNMVDLNPSPIKAQHE